MQWVSGLQSRLVRTLGVVALLLLAGCSQHDGANSTEDQLRERVAQLRQQCTDEFTNSTDPYADFGMATCTQIADNVEACLDTESADVCLGKIRNALSSIPT